MKQIIYFMIVIFLSLPILSFANCPAPESITISSTFKVTAPPGYRYLGYTHRIKATGPMSLAGVTLFFNESTELPHLGPYHNVSVENVNCAYGIGMTTPGYYPQGVFIIANTTPFSTDLDKNWSASRLGVLQCIAYKTDCYFG